MRRCSVVSVYGKGGRGAMSVCMRMGDVCGDIDVDV